MTGAAIRSALEFVPFLDPGPRIEAKTLVSTHACMS